MKKSLFAVILLVLVMGLAACGGKKAGEASGGDVAIDYGKSDLYTQEDMDAAIALIKEQFKEFPEGCELKSISYASDDCNSEENLVWMNELKGASEFTQVIEFLSDFHTPKENSGSLEADADYLDFEWWLARTEGGEWELLTWGY